MRIKLFSWFKSEAKTEEMRAWQAKRQLILCKFVDTTFRCIEMVFVTGAVRYLETKYGSNGIISTILSALILIYVRGCISAALFPAIERYNLSEEARHRLWWAFWVVGIVAWIAANLTINSVLPIITSAQH